MVRELDFTDGFESESAPSGGPASASQLKSFADDAAFVTDKGAAASQGDMYYNTTSNVIRYYNNSQWNVIANLTQAQTFADNVTITGDLTVNGTTTTVNTTNLEVADKNININDGGDDASSEGAGINVERTGTDGSLIYEDALASKFKLGAAGSENEIADVSSTQTLTGKTHTDPIIDHIVAAHETTPSNPSSGFVKVYAKSDNKMYVLNSGGTETELGSGGQGAKNYFSNPNFESDSTGVSTYDDTGAYVDGDGGSPIAVSISTTTVGGEVLAGARSLKLSKAASDASGEGWTFLTDAVDPIDRGKVLYGSFAIDADHANYVADDIKIHAYDVTNAAELYVEQTTWNTEIPKAKTEIEYTVHTTTTTQTIRVSLHIVTDNISGSAYDIFLDEFKLGPQELINSVSYQDWNSFTPEWKGVTTDPVVGNGVIEGFWRQVGDSIEVIVSAKMGSTTTFGSGAWYWLLPNFLNVDAAKIPTSSAGTAQSIGITYSLDAGTIHHTGNSIYDPATDRIQVIEAGSWYSSTNPFTWTTNDLYSVRFVIPIVGWSGTAPVQNSKVFNISTFLANGTRLTSTPLVKGDYRTMIKTAATSSVYTDDAPTTAPSAADGIRLYSVNHASAGASGQPNKAVMFIGKGFDKGKVELKAYQSAGRSGLLDWRHMIYSTTNERGVYFDYDPVTGLAVIDASACESGTITTRQTGLGISPDLTGHTAPTNAYFDLTVAENVLAVQVETTQIISPEQNMRVYSALIAGSSGTPSVTRQDGDWIDSITDNGVGLYTINIKTGIFSVAPNCVSTAVESTGGRLSTIRSISTTAIGVDQRVGSTALLIDQDFTIMCIGPR